MLLNSFQKEIIHQELVECWQEDELTNGNGTEVMRIQMKLGYWYPKICRNKDGHYITGENNDLQVIYSYARKIYKI